jgi:hypothetical protein
LLCRCLAMLLCVALRCIGRSLRLSAAVVTQQRWRCALAGGAAVVLSHDTSGWLCRVVALSPPRGRCVPRCGACRRPWCARLCVCSTSRLSNIVVLLFCMRVTRGIRSLSAVAVLLLFLLLLFLLLLFLLLLCAERLSACP